MHLIAQHLPVGHLITPFTIIIASITQPDTGKKTVESGRAGEKNIQQSARWVSRGREDREGQRERNMGDKDKETEQEDGEKLKW